MSKVVTTTVLPDVAGGSVTLGGTGDSVVATGNDIRTNIMQDAGGNAVFTSDGSGTMSGMNSAFGGALNLIQSQTASNSASVSFTSGIDSTYDVYIFKFYNINPDTSSNFQFEGSTNSGSSYGVTKTTTAILPYHNEDDSGTGLYYETNTDHAQSTSAQILGSPANDADSGFTGELHLFSPASTVYVKHFYTTSSYFTSVPYAGNMMIGGYFNTTSAVDAVQFKMSSGNMDGVIKLYGISKS